MVSYTKSTFESSNLYIIDSNSVYFFFFRPFKIFYDLLQKSCFCKNKTSQKCLESFLKNFGTECHRMARNQMTSYAISIESRTEIVQSMWNICKISWFCFHLTFLASVKDCVSPVVTPNSCFHELIGITKGFPFHKMMIRICTMNPFVG